jgi:peptide/nickel transport system substrate-binding protein
MFPTAKSISSTTLAALVSAAVVLAVAATAARAQFQESPALGEQVAAGTLPPVDQRLPSVPYVDPMNQPWQEVGRYGGRLRLLMAKVRDLRQMVVYGYARLVGYTPDLDLQADILERVDNQDNKVFTLHLRPGHKWSDGQPFTSEDFRYWWEDVANNEELSPVGPPIALTIEGEPPRVEILDETTVRYSWSSPNPTFLHELAKASPIYIYRPAHYLKQFHKKYADEAELAKQVEGAHQRNWAALHNRLDDLYRNDNVALPSLQPWVNITKPPSYRFRFKRNPYFHRVDPKGQQLPYIDEVVIQIASSGIIPAKTGAGDSDLQARYLRFDNFTFLKAAETRQDIKVRLWRTARGARRALFPNMNVNDEVYRALFQDVRFRRALSLAIDREEINQVIFSGLAIEGNNTVLPGSPLYKEDYRTSWAEFDLDEANRLLDEIGLSERNGEGTRLMSDGRPLYIIVESAGESTEEPDILELIRESWAMAGIKLYIKTSQREVLRRRIYAGEVQMSIWPGLENGLVVSAMSPVEFAPTRQEHFQWPRWGQFVETKGKAGQAPDMAEAIELTNLYHAWSKAPALQDRERIWHRMLELHAEGVFSIGLVAGVPRPIVTDSKLRNLPEEGLYNWDPGAFFGIYHPDTIWFGSQ